MASEWLTPGIIIAVVIAVWRLLHADIKGLGDRIDKLNQRLDSHLENHAPKQ